MKRPKKIIVLCAVLCVGTVGIATMQSSPNEIHMTEAKKEAIVSASYFFSEECQHENAIKRAAQAPTCTQSGKTEYIRCLDCGYFVPSTDIPALGHDLSEVDIAASCENDGFIGKKCLRCDYSEGETVAATGHAPIAYEEILADCTHAGYTGGSYCADCRQELTPRREIAPNGHRYVEEVISATCTEAGKKIKTCEVCGDRTETDIAASGHDFEVVGRTEATCEQDGTEDRVCVKCGVSEITIVPKLGHSYGRGTQTKTPTCTEDGVLTFNCATCGKTKEEVLPALGHVFGEAERRDATCTTGGYLAYTCTVCRQRELVESYPALGHDFGDWHEETAAGCEEEGKITRFCGRCSFEEENILPPTGHAWSDWSGTAATCTEAGERERTCSICQKGETEHVAAHGHSYGEWQELSMPTCTEDGSLVRYCIYNSAHTETRMLPATGHTNIQKTAAVIPTCTKDGHSAGTFCLTCGEEIERAQTIPAFGHAWDEGETIVRATYQQTGEIEYSCRICGAVRSETVAMLGGKGALFLEAVKRAEEAGESELLSKTEYALQLYESVEYPELVQEEYERLTALYARAKGASKRENENTEVNQSGKGNHLWMTLVTVVSGVLCGTTAIAYLSTVHKRRHRK